ncbi:uncharacterized protein EI90DRAFT_2382451 [Cantharellus anzutake]|uniref:uncharacterized protein n=1 Tax=Cantharellus anzutake TaxID=1750568 RepID=UPI0019068859|nr:uncharacterized protein EI90DRAFT_2382451 [Cantharellus anzutake]KAF8323491.1 hypothetical protein EI90DRAFT_2382451 [Cantharellus anzutake]
MSTVGSESALNYEQHGILIRTYLTIVIQLGRVQFNRATSLQHGVQKWGLWPTRKDCAALNYSDFPALSTFSIHDMKINNSQSTSPQTMMLLYDATLCPFSLRSSPNHILRGNAFVLANQFKYLGPHAHLLAAARVQNTTVCIKGRTLRTLPLCPSKQNVKPVRPSIRRGKLCQQSQFQPSTCGRRRF